MWQLDPVCAQELAIRSRKQIVGLGAKLMLAYRFA